MNKIAFSVDMDDWYHSAIVSGAEWSIYPDIADFYYDWKGRYDYITESTRVLLKLLDKYQVKATFFVIADIIERYPEVVKMLQGSAHEIANHSLHHTVPFNTQTKLPIQTESEWEEELRQANKILEETFGKEVVGYRAPNAYFARWMIPVLQRNGFLYDSSLNYNSFFSKSDFDLKRMPRRPFHLNERLIGDVHEAEIIEIPWSNYNFAGITLPGGGAFFFRLLGAGYFKKVLKQSLQYGDTLFYIHALDLSDEKFPLKNFKKRPFYWINKGKHTLTNLEKILNAFDGRFTTCREIVDKLL